jgi:uncharacterized protein
MNIWIDLANSPHVLFFKPIIHELETKGHNVFVTHRNFAQTSRLCKIYGINSTEIGIHGGQGVIQKIWNIIGRALQLRNFANERRIDIAVSHNSYAHCIAAKFLGLRYITMMDYEYQPANHINFRLADEILVPFIFELKDICKYGARWKKLTKYPGFKEEVYLWQFERDRNFWFKEFPELDSKKIMCTVRPPATMAAYHNFENPIFNELLRFLLSHKDVQVIFFPRIEEQRREYSRLFPKLFIAAKTVDGAQLVANSDLVISGGGTMNREAAMLGTPAYTIYAGKMGSVDTFLIKEGKIQIIENKDDFQKIQLRKRDPEMKKVTRKVFDFILNRITEN